MALYATSGEAGIAFARIREAWLGQRASGGLPDAELRAMVEQFIAANPRDGLVPVARAYLALLYMRNPADYPKAEAELALLKDTPPGSTRDLADTARARWFRLHGKPNDGLALIERNTGKNVDPIVRAVFQEELVELALAASKGLEAIANMDAWMRTAGEEEREVVRARVVAKIDEFDIETLKTALQAIRRDRARFGYSNDILRIVAEKLAKIALRESDGPLARMLLDQDAGAVEISGDAGIELLELASSRHGLNVVEGRTIGLLLPTEAPSLRDEAASVLRGVMWALGLPRGIRRMLQREGGLVSLPRAKLVVPDAGLACPRSGGYGDVPESEEPSEKDNVTLVIRDDAGDATKVKLALAELAGQGASVIIAALDPITAKEVRGWSKQVDVPVIVLAAPAAESDADGRRKQSAEFPYTFVLGEDREHLLRALTRAIPELTSQTVVPVIDESEGLGFPELGGRYPYLNLGESVSCDISPAQAGDPRFPLAKWEAAKRHAWIVTGAPSCARDVIEELASRGRTGTVALSLEPSSDLALARRPPGLRVVTLSAGVVPFLAGRGERDAELMKYVEAFGGKLEWWTALGRDAATLARTAVMALAPSETASDVARVAERRDLVRKTLGAARVRLWTSEARGFASAQELPRGICVMDLAP